MPLKSIQVRTMDPRITKYVEVSKLLRQGPLLSLKVLVLMHIVHKY